MTTYSIERFENGHVEATIACLNAAMPKAGITRERFLWKHQDTFHQQPLVGFVALFGSRVIACYLNTSLPVRRGEVVYHSRLCAVMATRPEYRRQGLISTLSRAVYAEIDGADFTVGFSNRAGIIVDQHARGYGYQVVGEFRSRIVVCFPSRTSPYSVRQCDAPDAKVLETCHHLYWQIDKSSTYLDWRYTRNPKYACVCLEVREAGAVVGYLYVRQHHLSATLLEICLPARLMAHLSQIFRTLEGYLLTRGKLWVEYQGLENRVWRQAFAGRMTLPRFTQERYALTVKRHESGRAIDASLEDPEEWLLTAGDVL